MHCGATRGSTALPISAAASVWAAPAPAFVQLPCRSRPAGDATASSATLRAPGTCAIWGSQKRSASWAYWLAWVCSRLLLATWSPLVALRMIAAEARPITASISIAMISEKPRAAPRAARGARARDALRTREERGGAAMAHSSLFCNTMVVVNVRRM